MKQTLKYILSLVMENLKIAENKHGFILAINSGLVVITVGFFNSEIKLVIFLNWLVILFACISIFFCFLGLFARNIKFLDKYKNPKHINLLYYKDVSTFSELELIKCIIINYGFPKDYVVDNFEKDLAREIIVNSKIAIKKYKLFNISVVFLMVALFLDVSLMAIMGFIS